MRLTELLDAICADLKARLPSLRACEVHGGRFDLAELKRIAGRAPAIYVAVLGAPQLKDVGNGQRDAELNLAAFVITADRRGLARGVAALNLVEALLTHIPGQRWRQSGVFDAEAVSARNFYSGDIDKQGVALWGLSWTQRIRLGDSQWDADGVLPAALYLGLAPGVGSSHAADYERITEVPA